MDYSAEDFARLFGVTFDSLPKECIALIDKSDFNYDLPTSGDRDQIILGVLKHLDSDAPTQVGEQRSDLWERCWSENLQNFVSSEFELDKLVPKFIKPGQPIRLNQQYVMPRNASFELAFFQVCRAYFGLKYFADAKSLYEFGCGTGFNLVALGKLLPHLKLNGLDWSLSACEMVNLIGKHHDLHITGSRFDFFAPDNELSIAADSAVMTMVALEQTGQRNRAFIDFLLAKRPKICLHMEPLIELYDENMLVDHLAMRYHRKRGYLSGLLPYLNELASMGKIEILETRRMFFGSLYHEGYSFVVWRPQ
jgi:hypothetical protein